MKKIIFILFCSFFILLLPCSIKSLTISPPLIDLEGSPGQTIVEEFRVINETDEPVELSVSIEGFRAKGEEGQPEFVSPEEEEAEFYNWIEIDKEPFILLPQTRKTIPLIIRISEKASPGGYYAAIFWSTAPPKIEEEKIAIGVVGKIGALILLKITGEVKEEGRLLEFFIKERKRILNRLPVNFVVRFENTGNVHLKPEGEIEIIDVFGKIIASLLVNKRRANVLPESVRKFENKWETRYKGAKGLILEAKTKENFLENFIREFKNEKNNFAFGKFFAQLNLRYGKERKSVEATRDFWIIPWRIFSFSLVSLIIVLIFLVWCSRRYNQWIITKYQTKLMEEEEKRREKKE